MSLYLERVEIFSLYLVIYKNNLIIKNLHVLEYMRTFRIVATFIARTNFIYTFLTSEYLAENDLNDFKKVMISTETFPLDYLITNVMK